MTDTLHRITAALADRYVIEHELGEGGMATVYLARDVKHGRHVAIKVLRPELSVVLGGDRFLNEIKISASLEHPHILTLIDSGEVDGLLYYVMPFVEGESLRDRLNREKHLDASEAVAITRDVASALDYAHRRGVIHRDIKPENILLSEGGAVVADFGIALAMSEAGGERLTETGVSLGTPGYMSPEQATGDSEITAASDIYSLASVLFEMLSGEPPFTGNSVQSVLAKVITAEPPHVRVPHGDASPEIDAAVRRGLAKDPGARWERASELAEAVRRKTGRHGAVPARGRRLALVVGALFMAAIGFFGFRFYQGVAAERWVRNVAVPEISRLIDTEQLIDAHLLAQEALGVAPVDPAVQEVLRAASNMVTGTSEPGGASVYYRGYSARDTAWQFVATTPFSEVWFPQGHIRLKLELDGYDPLEMGFSAFWGALDVKLQSTDSQYSGMVWVPSGPYGFTGESVPVDGFHIDRIEVSNAEFQRFVDDGGYRDPQFWQEEIRRDGELLAWADGVALFEDATGRPGPSVWELGRFPAGHDDYPVGGVSWYEAVAYCRYAGKRLPTWYHWQRAADPAIGVWDDVFEFSNFNGDGPMPVGTNGGIGPHGTHDLAGNVKEWVWNESKGLRRINGGAWNEPEYRYLDHDAVDPLERDPTHGFRCASFEIEPASALYASVDLPEFDFNEVEPVDDATFAMYERFYTYDPQPLEARVESADTTGEWRKETVTFTAAYGDERVTVYLYLPTDVEPPYQTVVLFPGAAAFRMQSSEFLADFHLMRFIPQSGRALVYPVLKGTYERNVQRRPGAVAYRERTVWIVQDVNRTVDFILERPDLDGERLGYVGVSMGAEYVIPYAMESRFKALALIGGAFDAAWIEGSSPESSPWYFTHRVTAPVVLINGRRDFMHPYETGQVPFFNALGTPDEHKKFVVLEAGHIPPWNDVVRHTLDWFDQYLGPVWRTGAPMGVPTR